MIGDLARHDPAVTAIVVRPAAHGGKLDRFE
jgi:hypothetical protein